MLYLYINQGLPEIMKSVGVGVNFYPTKKRWWEKVLAMLKRGEHKRF